MDPFTWFYQMFTTATGDSREEHFFALAILLVIALGAVAVLFSLGKGTESIMKGIGRFIGEGLTSVPVNLSEGTRDILSGIGHILDAPHDLITGYYETEQARIEAETQTADIVVSDGRRSVTVKLAGKDANDNAPKVFGALAGTSQQVFKETRPALADPDEVTVVPANKGSRRIFALPGTGKKTP